MTIEQLKEELEYKISDFIAQEANLFEQKTGLKVFEIDITFLTVLSVDNEEEVTLVQVDTYLDKWKG